MQAMSLPETPVLVWSDLEKLYSELETRLIDSHNIIITFSQLPFYYLEYALSWLGALQLWQQSLSDPKKTLSNYRSSLELGDSCSVPELFDAAGARFAFD